MATTNARGLSYVVLIPAGSCGGVVTSEPNDASAAADMTHRDWAPTSITRCTRTVRGQPRSETSSRPVVLGMRYAACITVDWDWHNFVAASCAILAGCGGRAMSQSVPQEDGGIGDSTWEDAASAVPDSDAHAGDAARVVSDADAFSEDAAPGLPDGGRIVASGIGTHAGECGTDADCPASSTNPSACVEESFPVGTACASTKRL